MARKKRSMEDDRLDRVRSTGANGDASAGDEGVDDPAMSRTRRDDMSTTPRHGDELEEASNRDMNEDVGSDNRMQSQRSRRTRGRANDERWDNADDFTGKGNQREGSSRPEGTGYRDADSSEDTV